MDNLTTAPALDQPHADGTDAATDAPTWAQIVAVARRMGYDQPTAEQLADRWHLDNDRPF